MIVDHYNVSFSMICNGSTSSCVGIASVGFGAIYNKFTRLRSRSEPCHHFLASSGRGPFVMALHFLAQCTNLSFKLKFRDRNVLASFFDQSATKARLANLFNGAWVSVAVIWILLLCLRLHFCSPISCLHCTRD